MAIALANMLGLVSAEDATVFTTKVLPGDGVADPAEKTGFFPNTGGGIVAISLATGKVLWTNKDAGRPLAATAQRLFVQTGQANQVRVVVLDTTNGGKRVLESEPIVFPEWVATGQNYGRTFRSTTRVEGKSLWLTWEAAAFYAGGAAPPPEVEAAARKSASGVARVDVETGKIETLDAAKIAAGKFFPMPEVVPNPQAGALTLTIKDEPSQNPQTPLAMRRTLQAVNPAQAVVWQQEIAAPVLLIPPP